MTKWINHIWMMWLSLIMGELTETKKDDECRGEQLDGTLFLWRRAIPVSIREFWKLTLCECIVLE